MGRVSAAKCSSIALCLMLVSAFQAVAEAPAKCPEADANPFYKTHTLVPYPNSSLRRHEQGISLFSVSIDASGAPSGVVVVKTSASERLNDAAVEYIRENWRWPEPTQDCPSTVQTTVRVIWNQMSWPGLPEAEFHIKMPISAYPPDALVDTNLVRSSLLLIDTDQQGAVTDGRVIESSGFTALDNQALIILKNSPALLKGQAAGRHVVSAEWTSNSQVMPSGIETQIRTGVAAPP